MQLQTVSKSEFKAKALGYLRLVETNKKPLLVTHNGKVVVQISVFKHTPKTDPLKALIGSVIKYERPNDPVGLENWEALKG